MQRNKQRTQKAIFIHIDKVTRYSETTSNFKRAFDQSLNTLAEMLQVSSHDLMQCSIIQHVFNPHDTHSMNKLLCLCAGLVATTSLSASWQEFSIDPNESPSMMGVIINAHSLIKEDNHLFNDACRFLGLNPWCHLSAVFTKLVELKKWTEKELSHGKLNVFILGVDQLTAAQSAVLKAGLNHAEINPISIQQFIHSNIASDEHAFIYDMGVHSAVKKA